MLSLVTAILAASSAQVLTEVNPLMIVPKPVRLESSGGVFPLSNGVSLLFNPGDGPMLNAAKRLQEYLASAGAKVSLSATSATDPPVRGILLTTHGADPSLGEEGYELVIQSDRATLRAPTPAGLFWGTQSLRQMLLASDGATLPTCRIWDKPRFRWRGSLLDCCRHFMTKDFVKRYIDLLALHKLNVLHWHLTEDQGWRIEIERYPELTLKGAWRGEGTNRHGGFYTQREVREIVEYAAQRHIMVVPEIEMPGHSMAALACYPELSCTGGPFEVPTQWGVFADVYCAGNEQVFEFLENVLKEVVALFPAPYVHIGGDEVPKTRWQKCPKCQERMSKEGLKDEHELQSYFIRRAERMLAGMNRKLIGWDEILEGGLAPNATVQSWRGMEGAVTAAKAGHDVIVSPTTHCYLDYGHDSTSLQKAYSFEPIPPELTPEEAKHVLGGEGNIWTEYAPQEVVDERVYPRLSALAEVFWSPKDQRDWQDFTARMGVHYHRLDRLGVRYYLEPPRFLTDDEVFLDSIKVEMQPSVPGGTIRYTLGSDPLDPGAATYHEPIELVETTTVRAVTHTPAGRTSPVTERTFRKEAILPPVAVGKDAPGLQVYYYEGKWSSMPSVSSETPIAAGIVPDLDLGFAKRDHDFFLSFRGYLTVPEDGVYTFYLTSDDGSVLRIGDRLLANNDGLHPEKTVTASIALRAGRHPIEVGYFQSGGAMALRLEYKGPGIPRQRVPASAYSRREQ